MSSALFNSVTAGVVISHMVPVIMSLLPLVIIINVLVAISGSPIGFTKLYVRSLLALFEWGKERIRIFERSREEGEEEDDDQETSEYYSASGGEIPIYYSDRYKSKRESQVNNSSHGFQLTDAMFFLRKGMEVITEDTVTQRFDAAELPSWNLLTRTNTHYEFISVALCAISVTMLIGGCVILGLLPDGRLKRWLNYRWERAAFRVLMRSFLAVITFHDRQNRARGGGICVANHTSPLDVFVLGSDNSYALVGQKQGGFMGFLQEVLTWTEHHIWFQRSEAKDRLEVVNRLRDHVDNPNKRPILIFPEGTCVNNTSIMMFKKGSFEIGRSIYPVAIKYDTRFADAFWNSSKQNMLHHILNILTSWSLVADVWYLPPQKQWPEETVIEFTNRVKHMIANRGGLVELEWDGSLKREKPRPSFLLEQQQQYSKHIIQQDDDNNHEQ